MKSPWGLLLLSAYLPIQKDPRCTRVWNLPVDVQIIQRAGVGVADMLVDPAFIKFTEVGFCEDGTALGLVHGGAEQVLHIMHRHDYRRTGRIKDAEKILAAAAHGALAVAALNVDIVAPLGLFLGDILMPKQKIGHRFGKVFHAVRPLAEYDKPICPQSPEKRRNCKIPCATASFAYFCAAATAFSLAASAHSRQNKKEPSL